MRAYQDRYPGRDLTAVQRAPQDRKSATMRARSKPDATTCSGAYQRREGSLGNKVRPIGNGSVESNAHKGTARIPTWGRMHPDRTKHFHLQAYLFLHHAGTGLFHRLFNLHAPRQHPTALKGRMAVLEQQDPPSLIDDQRIHCKHYILALRTCGENSREGRSASRERFSGAGADACLSCGTKPLLLAQLPAPLATLLLPQ